MEGSGGAGKDVQTCKYLITMPAVSYNKWKPLTCLSGIHLGDPRCTLFGNGTLIRNTLFQSLNSVKKNAVSATLVGAGRKLRFGKVN